MIKNMVDYQHIIDWTNNQLTETKKNFNDQFDTINKTLENININNNYYADKVIGTTYNQENIYSNNVDYLCDGINDEEEIQQAINSLIDKGGRILLLSGTYNIGTNLPIRFSSNTKHINIVLEGQGMSTMINCNQLQNSDLYLFEFNGPAVTIKNLQIYNFKHMIVQLQPRTYSLHKDFYPKSDQSHNHFR